MLDYTRKENQLLTKEVCTRFYTLIFRRETFLPKQRRSAAAIAVRWFHLIGVYPRASRAKNSQKFQAFFKNSGNFHKIVKEFRRFQKKIAKMLQIPPSEREPGGAHLFWGFHYTLFWERSLTWRLVWSRKTSAFFSQNWEKSEHFQPRFWKLSKTSSDHHAAGFLKTDLKFWDQKAKTLF